MLPKSLSYKDKARQVTRLNLKIAGTGGTEVKTRSRRVELIVTNLDGKFSSPLQAHVPLTILLATLQLFAGQN